MTPIWIFPAYPLLIVGPHAGNLAPKIASSDPTKALLIVISGYVIQGIGFLVSTSTSSSLPPLPPVDLSSLQAHGTVKALHMY